MPSTPVLNSPKYRRQKKNSGSDLAFVEMAGVRYYLGVYNSPESQNAYHRKVAEWIESGRTLLAPASQDVVTVVELAARYWEHAKVYYRKQDGTPTSEQDVYKQVLRHLKKLYGSLRVVEFGPKALKTIRQAMIDTGTLNRKTVNAYIGRVKAIFKWGVEQEIVSPSIWHGLQAVGGLRRGRTNASEPDRVLPVAQTHIDAIEAHVSRQVWALIQLQLFTGARAGEIVTMKATKIDTSGKIWLYEPVDHKTSHHGHDRTIYIGPRGQEIIAPFLASRPIGEYLFSAIEAERERNAKSPSHRRSNQESEPNLTPRKVGEHYTTASYRRAITRACKKANVPSWHPHQLRHSAGTYLRKEFNVEVARIILGHRSAETTDLYAELDREKALEAMLKSG